MNNPILYYVILVGISILGIFKNSVSLSPLRFHCNNYMLNTYLYFILSWGIVLSTVTAVQYQNIPVQQIFTKPFTILLMIGSFVLILGLMALKAKTSFITKHILFIFLLILFGVTLYPLYILNKDRFNHVGLTTIGIFLILSIITVIRPQLVSDSWGMYLFIALIALLVARLIEIFVIEKANNGPISNYSRMISYAAIGIFTLFIMYDTRQVMINAVSCRVSPFGPDYINESINLFLDSMNLFTNLYSVDVD
tara:strand:+ start:1967 stop:2722 length:756 start_codon:yes stop_codon:yes gene_type:complete